jgi:integrase
MGDISNAGLKSKLKALSDRQLTKAARIGVGDGLHLLVKPSAKPGTGVWVLRLMHAGKRRDMGLGTYPVVGLADARLAAAQAKSAARGGIDPILQRSDQRAAVVAEGSQRFQEVAIECISFKEGGWKNSKHPDQWRRTLEEYVFPKLGNKKVSEIDTPQVIEVLQPIWSKIPETASRVRGRIESILNYAAVQGYRARGFNPAAWRGQLEEILPAPSKMKAAKRRMTGKGEHFPSLHCSQMVSFIDALRRKDAMGALALEMVILTAARSGIVRQMLWSEVDLEQKLWILPAGKMKTEKDHIITLSSQSIDLLRRVKALAPSEKGLVFPGRTISRPLSDMTLSQLVRGMSYDGLTDTELPRWRDDFGRCIVPHGFRATFKQWSLAAGYPDHLSEIALAHADNNKVRAAYARDPMIEERRPMMQAWADSFDL